jgi:hypothetical protein
VGKNIGQEEPSMHPLALQPPLHVRRGDQDGVDLATLDLGAQVLDRQRGCLSCHCDPPGGGADVDSMASRPGQSPWLGTKTIGISVSGAAAGQ